VKYGMMCAFSPQPSSQLLGGLGVLVDAKVPAGPGYPAGENVAIRDRGFKPAENVTLQVTHADGTAEGGAGHETWTVVADVSGVLSATWSIDRNDDEGPRVRHQGRWRNLTGNW
jgi:hypothetical protein